MLRKTRAGIYARQSHGKQRSIAEQITECTRDAEAQGYEVVEKYEDTTSASRHARKARPDHTRLLADLAANRLDVVVVWETSRADRRLTSWSELLDWCRDNGVLIRVTDDDETYDVRRPKHWKQLATDGISNAYASEETRQRNLRTARLTAEDGKPNGPTPYGYIRRYDPVTRELVAQEPDPDAGPIVAEIFARIAAGEPVKTLADELIAREVPPPGQWRKGNHRWSPRAVRQIVRSKAYIGRRAYNGDPDDREAVWQPIVSETVFWRAQRVLDERADKFWRSTRAEHVLTGIPRCGAEGCEGVFGGALSSKLDRQIYSCRVCGRSVDGAGLEELVLAYVLGRLAREDIYTQLRRAGEDADAEVSAARAEADRLRKRLDEWRDSAIRGETTPASLATVETELTKQIAAADRRAERAGIPPAVRDLVDARDELPERWASMPLQARRDVVAALVDVKVKPGRRGGRMPVEERVAVTWKGTAS